jgi:tetratricopeptide (TPR) repeat protein
MTNLTPSGNELLAALQIDPKAIRTVQTPWKRSTYQAIVNWLTKYQVKPNASNLEQVRGYLEAIDLFCDLQDWEKAEVLLTVHLDTPTSEELHSQLFTWGYYQEQIQLYQRLLNQGDTLLNLTCLNGLGNACDRLGNYAQAIDYHQQCLVLAQQMRLVEVAGKALCNLGNAYFSMNQYAKAAQYYSQYLALAQSRHDRQAEGIALGNLGNLYRVQGDYPKALETLKQRLTIAQACRDWQGEENAWGNLGTVYLLLQDYEMAIECQQRSLDLARTIGNRAGEARALGNLGAVYQALGDTTGAIECIEAMRSLSQTIGDREAEQAAVHQLGLLHLSLGHYEQAIGFQQQELAAARASGDWLVAGSLLLNLATATRTVGEYAHSMTYYQDLLKIVQNMEEAEGEKWVLEAMAFYGLAQVHQALNNPELAIEYCDQMLAMQYEIVQPIADRCADLKQQMLNAAIRTIG